MVDDGRAIPTRQDILQRMVDYMYSPPIIDNAHRGDVVEMMVLAALGDDWKHVGLGWHPCGGILPPRFSPRTPLPRLDRGDWCG